MSKLSEREKIQLISLVHDRPTIWNTATNGAISRAVKSDEFKTIAEEMGQAFEKEYSAEALRNAWRVLQICFYRERRKSGSKWRYLEQLEFLGNLSQKNPKKRIAENVKDESMEEPDHEKNELAEYSDESDQKTRENTSNELSALQQSIDASNGLLFAPKPGEGNNSLATEDQPVETDEFGHDEINAKEDDSVNLGKRVAKTHKMLKSAGHAIAAVEYEKLISESTIKFRRYMAEAEQRNGCKGKE